MNIKESIRQYATTIGIDCVGFTTADPFFEIEKRLRAQYDQQLVSGFEEKEIARRINPKLTMPTAKTIISIAIAYPSKTLARQDNKVRGSFSSSSYGKDYHHVLRERMAQLACYIEEKTGAVSQCFSDTGPLVDTVVARRAGVGFIGKNGLLITENYGSYVYLGYIMSEIDVAADEILATSCGSCVKCIDACPTNALFGNGSMNAKKCLSYQTQKKGVVTEPYRSKMGKMLYGCDICQMVCPYNKGINNEFHEEMMPVLDDVKPEISQILRMTKRQFKDKFGYMAGAWRGVHVTRRNALIAARNLKASNLVPEIELLLEEEVRQEIRVTALEALLTLTGSIPQKYFEEVVENCGSDTEIKEAYKEIYDRLSL